MKLECEVIRDLLPLYAENMVSPASRKLTEAHLAECEPCRQYLAGLTAPAPDVQFRVDSAQQFVRFEKKRKRKFGWTVGIIATVFGAVATYFLIRILFLFGIISGLILDSSQAPVKTDTDPAHYSQYMGENVNQEYLFKKGKIDESIFPAELTENMDVREYKTVYYNPWDPQYLSYLTVAYSPEDYAAEVQRLTECGIADYQGSYGVTGFPGGEPLAVCADYYYGFVYAVNTPGADNTITYCELIFCNWFMDLDYTEYMPAEYLPVHFNAHSQNAKKQEAWAKEHDKQQKNS